MSQTNLRTGLSFYEHNPFERLPLETRSLTDNWGTPIPEDSTVYVKDGEVTAKVNDFYVKVLTGPTNAQYSQEELDSLVSDTEAVRRWRQARDKWVKSDKQDDFEEMMRWVRADVDGYDEDGLPEPGHSTQGRVEDGQHRRGLGRLRHRKDDTSPARPV